MADSATLFAYSRETHSKPLKIPMSATDQAPERVYLDHNATTPLDELGTPPSFNMSWLGIASPTIDNYQKGLNWLERYLKSFDDLDQ